MEKELNIDLSNEVLKGSILDIGFKNLGIVYNACKKVNKEVSIDYVEDNFSQNLKNKYDYCTLFLTFKDIWKNKDKEKLFKFIYDNLKDQGKLLVWDIDKPKGKYYNYKVCVKMSQDKEKELIIKDYNKFKNNSKDNIIFILEKYFKINQIKYSDPIFFIKAQKKEGI